MLAVVKTFQTLLSAINGPYKSTLSSFNMLVCNMNAQLCSHYRRKCELQVLHYGVDAGSSKRSMQLLYRVN